MEPSHAKKDTFLAPTSKALSRSSTPSLKKRRCVSEQKEDVSEQPMAIADEFDIQGAFDPEIIRPTQWLKKLLDLSPVERNAFVVAWVIGHRKGRGEASPGRRFRESEMVRCWHGCSSEEAWPEESHSIPSVSCKPRSSGHSSGQR